MMWWLMGHRFPFPGMMPGHTFPLAWGLVGLLTSILFWGALAFLVVWVVRTLVSGQRPAAPADPLTILKARYARGDVTREQFEQMRTDLQQ